MREYILLLIRVFQQEQLAPSFTQQSAQLVLVNFYTKLRTTKSDPLRQFSRYRHLQSQQFQLISVILANSFPAVSQRSCVILKLLATISNEQRIVNAFIQLSSYLIIIQMIQKQSRDTLAIILFFTSFVFNYFFLKYTASGHLLNPVFFWDIPITIYTQQQKFVVIRSLLAKCAVFLFALVLATTGARAVTNSIMPVNKNNDPSIIRLLNRLIQNTLEQTAIFISLYSYFLFDKSGDKLNANQLVVLASWFMWARLAFVLAYSLGALIRMETLRSFGMGINFAIIFMMIQLCFLPNHYLTNHIFSI